MGLDLMASELSMFIFENDMISARSLYELVYNYVLDKWGDKISPDNRGYVIDRAYEIYYKI